MIHIYTDNHTNIELKRQTTRKNKQHYQLNNKSKTNNNTHTNEHTNNHKKTHTIKQEENANNNETT